MEEYIEEIIKKTGIVHEELKSLMEAPTHRHEEYSHEVLAKILHKILRSHN